MVKFAIILTEESARGKGTTARVSSRFNTREEAQRFLSTTRFRTSTPQLVQFDTEAQLQAEVTKRFRAPREEPSQARQRELREAKRRDESRIRVVRTGQNVQRKQSNITSINRKIRDAKGAEKTTLIARRNRLANIPAKDFTVTRQQSAQSATGDPGPSREQTLSQVVPTRQAPTTRPQSTRGPIQRVRTGQTRVRTSTGPGLTESTLSLTAGGSPTSFTSRQVAPRFIPPPTTQQDFTPSGLVSPASPGLQTRSFISPSRETLFRRQGGIIGAGKSFASGAGQLLTETGRTVLREIPGVVRFPGAKKRRSTIGALQSTFLLTTLGAKTRPVKATLPLVGAGIVSAVRSPFRTAGQLAVTELAFRGARRIKTAAIERQPTSVKLATKGQIITTPSPTKPGVTVSVIRPTEFIAKTGGQTIAGVGEGRAATKIRIGDVVAGFKFRTRVAKQKPTTTEVAVRGKITQVTPEVSKGVFKSQIETTTATGKIVKQKAITVTQSEKIVGGQFPVFRTGGLELRAGKLAAIPFLETGIIAGRRIEPRFVRVGLTRKREDIVNPLFTGERFEFLEKGVSPRKFKQVEKKRRKDLKKLLQSRRGSLISPLTIPKPALRVSSKQQGLIAGQFLKSIRTAVRAERVAAIPKVRVRAVTRDKTQQLPGIGQIQRTIPRIKIDTKIKPILDTTPKIDTKVGLTPALKPTFDVAQKTPQKLRAATISRLTGTGRFAPTPTPLPIPVAAGGAAFALPIPKARLTDPFLKKSKKQKKRKLRGTPSLSVVLGFPGQQLTAGQIAGRDLISPFTIRQVKRRK